MLHHTVVDLVQPCTGVHRTLYFDNLYTSPELCDDLLQQRTRSCGTVRVNRRGMPSDARAARSGLAKGEMVAWQRGQLGCLAWHDSTEVLFLSTHLRVDAVTAVPAIGGRPATTRSTVSVDYNLNKGHVDVVDQLRSYHAVERRARRTWPTVAWCLLDMCIGNAYKLWSMEHNAKPGILHFREELVRQIAAAYSSPRASVQPIVPAVVHQVFVGHRPRRRAVRHDCSGGRRQLRRTDFSCAVCEVFLHPNGCFGAHHDRQEIDNRRV